MTDRKLIARQWSQAKRALLVEMGTGVAIGSLGATEFFYALATQQPWANSAVATAAGLGGAVMTARKLLKLVL